MYIVSFFIQAYKLGINIWAFEFAKDLASPALTSIMAIIGKSFLVVIPFLVLYLYFIKKDANVYTFIVAGVLFYVVSDAIKLITKEPRPCNVTELSWINNVACESSYSFPSNHASVLTGLTFFPWQVQVSANSICNLAHYGPLWKGIFRAALFHGCDSGHSA